MQFFKSYWVTLYIQRNYKANELINFLFLTLNSVYNINTSHGYLSVSDMSIESFTMDTKAFIFNIRTDEITHVKKKESIFFPGL